MLTKYELVEDGTGSLLNMKRTEHAPRELGLPTAPSKQLFNALKRLPKFAPNAVITLRCSENPKRRNAEGRRNFDLYFRHQGVFTVGDHNALALTPSNGYTAENQHGHLCWDVTHGYISVELPPGAVAPPGTTVPTAQFLLELAANLDESQ